jgi:hypothetical protein
MWVLFVLAFVASMLLAGRMARDRHRSNQDMGVDRGFCRSTWSTGALRTRQPSYWGISCLKAAKPKGPKGQKRPVDVIGKAVKSPDAEPRYSPPECTGTRKTGIEAPQRHIYCPPTSVGCIQK